MRIHFYTDALDLKSERITLSDFLGRHPDFEFERLLSELIRTGHGPGNSAMMLEYALVGYLSPRRARNADFPMLQLELSKEDRRLIEASHASLLCKHSEQQESEQKGSI